MKRAFFNVSADLITEALALPEGTKIIGISRDNFCGDSFTFLVEHDDLPEIEAGDPATALRPHHEITDYDRRPSTWVKFDWGLK